MEENSQEAGKPRVRAPKRQATKSSPAPKRQADTVRRVQLHLSATTVRRLAVHCGMVDRNQSRVADELLSSWLARWGKGKEMFPPLDPGESDVPVDSAA